MLQALVETVMGADGRIPPGSHWQAMRTGLHQYEEASLCLRCNASVVGGWATRSAAAWHAKEQTVFAAAVLSEALNRRGGQTLEPTRLRRAYRGPRETPSLCLA